MSYGQPHQEGEIGQHRRDQLAFDLTHKPGQLVRVESVFYIPEGATIGDLAKAYLQAAATVVQNPAKFRFRDGVA